LYVLCNRVTRIIKHFYEIYSSSVDLGFLLFVLCNRVTIRINFFMKHTLLVWGCLLFVMCNRVKRNIVTLFYEIFCWW
jgi:hypothetical protein